MNELGRLVAVRCLDKAIIKGLTFDFRPNRDFFHVEEQSGAAPMRVPIENLKAIFFIKTLGRDPSCVDKRSFEQRVGPEKKVWIEFVDGEKMAGWSSSFSSARRLLRLSGRPEIQHGDGVCLPLRDRPDGRRGAGRTSGPRVQLLPARAPTVGPRARLLRTRAPAVGLGAEERQGLRRGRLPHGPQEGRAIPPEHRLNPQGLPPARTPEVVAGLP